MKYVNMYQLALYLKGLVKEDEFRIWVGGFDKDQKEKMDDYEYKDRFEIVDGWSRIQLLLFLKPELNREFTQYGWWYYYDLGEEGEEDSTMDPNYKPDLCDNYSETSTKYLVEKLYKMFKCRHKVWVDVMYPEDIKAIKKGGRWRNKGIALKMNGSY